MNRVKALYTVKKKCVFKTISRDNGKLVCDPEITLKTERESGLKDGYRIDVKRDYDVRITYDHPRGLTYALDTLYKGIKEDGYLYIGQYDDAPSFEMRGIIEGFYGPPWSHEERLDVMEFLKTHRMNTYVYAPKDDPYHRELWRKPYPQDDLNHLERLVNKAQNNHIDFYFSISPGKDFNYTNRADFEMLYKKLDQVIALGVTDFCLLLDDIDYTLNTDDEKAYHTPGLAHAYITNQLSDYLHKKLTTKQLVFCPTEYWQNYDTPYRQDLKKHLQKDIAVFWTGFHTIAEFIPDTDGEKVLQSFGHPLILWDNYPVNDVTEDLIFMGPLVNRGPNLPMTHIGMVSNPMIQWELSKVALITMADYMWDSHRYDPEVAYQYALDCMAEGEFEHKQALSIVLENFRFSIISYDTIERIETAIENNDMVTVDAYYKTLLEAVFTVRSLNNQAFVNQMEPWLKRIEWDYALFQAIEKDDRQAVNKVLKALPDLAHTVGTNFAVKIAAKTGLYKGPIYKKYRLNFWED